MFIFSFATAVPFTLGVGWLNSKKVAMARKEYAEEKNATTSEFAIKPGEEDLHKVAVEESK